MFNCAICLEEKRTTRGNTIVLPNNDRVCSDCFSGYVVEQFWNSIRNTTEFPFRWGDKAVRFQDYARHIPAYHVLLRAYNAKKDELEVPAELRVYCDRDGEFLGQKKTAEELEKENLTGAYECDICGRLICKMCKNHAAANHQCPKKDAENNAFKGMKKGEEYQLCPTCSAPYFLGDGCNSCECKICQTQFCFICSKKVAHGDKAHWLDGCPRFNQPGALNAIFDNEVNIVDDPILDEEEEVLRGRPLHWNPLLRARVIPARDYLVDMRTRIRDRRDADTDRRFGFDAHLEHTLELMRNLIRNYGVFNVSDDGDIEPAEGIHGGGRAVIERHEQIRDFAHFPAAEWAWASFPRLRILRMWYLNHVRLDAEEMRVEANRHLQLKIWFVYGNPEIEDALQGQWWAQPGAH